ncbi:MAG: glycoside hydrolase family 5 protein, partial [Paludibacteraceae bacterium]|nr:glycoside hydrolase family 5 protein [Paludibacteraceae bacterium]
MNKKFLGLILGAGVTALASCGGGKADQKPSDATTDSTSSDAASVAEFTISRGVNLDHWLSQRGTGVDIDPNYITKKDFEQIKNLGFDFVRVPIEEQLMYNTDLTRRKIGFDLLDSAVKWSDETGLNMICDLHIIRSFHFNSENGEANTLFEKEEAQDNYVKVWMDIQDFLKNTPEDKVAYELLNEVTTPDPENWNKLIAKVHKAIRANEPTRKIIIGSNHWQIPSTFPDLKVPENDKNLILSFHYYNPNVITHYKAPWASFKDYTGKIQYPGDVLVDKDFFSTVKNEDERKNLENMCGVWDADRMEKEIMIAKNVADSLGLPLFCGEFGVFGPVAEDIKIKWYEDIMSVFSKNNISCCHW